jgi:hypothetical protein
MSPGLSAALAAAQLNSRAQATRSQYDLAFQVSPIILVGGAFASMQGGCMPIVYLYNQLALLNGGTTDPNQFFARYVPLPGSTLLSNQVGMYPFANQQVAANAIIVQPLTLSMLMIAPVNQPGGYLSKLSTFTSLQNALANHILAGGTFSVATPAFVYNNLLLLSMTAVEGDNQQQQIEWQIDFIQPLLTLEGAAAAQNNLMSKLSGGASFSTPPAWSGNTAAQLPPITGGLEAALQTFGAYTPNASSEAVGALP